MIEINLIVGKKPFKMPTVMGIDLGVLNIKMIVLAIILSFVPGMFLEDGREEEIALINEEINQLQQQLNKLQKKGEGNKSIEEQIEAHAKQEKKLAERLGVVKEIIKLKKNPMNVLLYISKNIPEEVWITSLDITNNNINIKGNAMTYKDIGTFVEILKGSVFFNKDLSMRNSKTIEAKDGNPRVEEFELGGTIARFD
ncbi:MAG: PilN domain-containing protein [Bacteriovoracaceae bacterium]